MLLFGACAAIAGWILGNKTDFHWSTNVDDNKVFIPYWWGGAGFVVIGSIGIAAGCTRNVCLMVMYLIFNIVGLLAVSAVSVIVALVVVVWTVINEANERGYCQSIPYVPYVGKKCLCHYQGETYTITDNDCSVVPTINTLLLIILATCAATGFLSFIASYLSCCALCHQENPPPVIITQPGGAYAPPPIVVAHATYSSAGMANVQQYGAPPQQYGAPLQQHFGAPPQQQTAPPMYPPAYSPQPQIQVHDEARLMKNQVI